MKESKKRGRKLTEWQLRADACIAHGALTNSKRVTHYPEGCPTHFNWAEGALAVDVTGNNFVDYVQALGGSGIFGYRPSKVIDAVKDQLDRGTIYSMGSDLEIEVDEDLQRFFPDHTHWRFFKTGTEACMAAVRIVRAVAGSLSIISEGYHGWSDVFVSLTPPSLGVHPNQNCFPPPADLINGLKFDLYARSGWAPCYKRFCR